MPYRISCGSTVDMPNTWFEERDISLIPYVYTIDDQEYLDDFGESLSIEDFYQKIRDGAMPTTSQISVGRYTDFFEQIVKNGQDCLHIAFSSGLSGSYNSAVLAAKQVEEKYPDRKVVVIDSLAASSGYGLLVDAAADKRDEGLDLHELAKWIEENKRKVHHWFFSTDLTHYKRGGRVSASAAFFGNLLNVCPLLNVDMGGHLIPREKVRSKRKVIRATVEKMQTFADDGLKYSGKCFISHSSSKEDASKVKELVEETFKDVKKPVLINDIGVIIGSHTGPGTVSLFYFGDERLD